MAEQIPMTAILIIFYAVFASQIYLLSFYYPGQLARRVRYVLDNFPPDQYPKLYPSGEGAAEARAGYRRLTLYRRYNQLIALIGVGILAAMIISGYRPAMKGGDEIFVLGYFMLQVVPFIFLAVVEFRTYSVMQQAAQSKQRTAELHPRRLFDFVEPAYVVAAVALYFAWVTFFLQGAGDPAEWQMEIYATLILITGMNIAYVLIIARFLYGKKLDPHQAFKDQLKTIESTIRVHVISSILISLFLIVTQAADQFSFEVFDPPLASLFVQLCMILGVGLTFRMTRVEDIDFEVYRKDAPVT